ncbi:hypothetical protein [Methanobrevibacter sp.]|uniref:hypothetical protein n=1 Tax=Methanobrevibacter sp. TaxID=66852 RepID=UPI0038909EBB
MNKIIFCLLLLPILLVGVCAVSASSDLDADVSDVSLYSPILDDHVANGHDAIEPISSDIERPILDGNFTDDNGSVPIVPIVIIDYDSNNQDSDRPSMDIPVIDYRPGSDVPVAEGESFGTILPYLHPCTVDDSNMEVFPYYPFGPHYAPVIGPCINPEHGFPISPRF